MKDKKPSILLETKVARYIIGKAYLSRYLCECGNKFVALPSTVKRYNSGCGCKVGKNISHGRSRSTEYRIWSGIMDRAKNKKSKYWDRYGGKGIGVSMEWEIFENFYKDMGPRPSKDYSIDRIDNTKGYSKENCRWATRRQQNNNRKSNRHIRYNGKIYTLANLCREHGKDPKMVRSRLRIGWSIEKALTLKLGRSGVQTK